MSSGTKLGAEKSENLVSRRSNANLGTDALQSRRSMANMANIFASHTSMRSMRSMASMGLQPNGAPLDQAHLTPKELAVQHTRTLTIGDPQAPKNVVRYNFRTHAFDEIHDPNATIMSCERISHIAPVSALQSVIESKKGGAGEEEEEDKGEEKVLRNQFNFSERATQGYVIEYIDEGTLTEAPVPKDSTGSTNQRDIAAYYTTHMQQPPLYPKPHDASAVIRVMERVVNQNMDPNVCCDFKYYDDLRDSTDPQHSFTLPLWEFKSDLVSGFQVTALEWNPSVHDLFAVAYSCLATDKTPGRGYVCTWTLKNHSTPRNILELPDRATAIDWCKTQPSILAVGTADGNISIYDVRSRGTLPIFSTQKLLDRHQTAITVICWQPLDSSGNLNLVSAGLDGRILQWTLIQSEMKVTEISKINAGIVSLDYYNESSTHFVAAADDGHIYEILRTRTTQAPSSFPAHSPPCAQICYNKFHKDVFITCGTDWQIKIWRNGQKNTPLQIFDFAPNSINDIKWAPHSSTVFAAVSSDGVLYIYDIAINRFQPICTTDILEINEGQLTSVSFHPKWPVILVGSEKGRVFSLKLSPNLRKNTKTVKEEIERSKMTKSSSKSQSSRGLLPDLTQPPDEDQEEGGAAAGEEDGAKHEELVNDETEKFINVMGVSWIKEETAQPFQDKKAEE